tara:strand:- start:51824 stop:54400 length:2577 start_codon:yes stop_codon:yes gene_type:complete
VLKNALNFNGTHSRALALLFAFYLPAHHALAEDSAVLTADSSAQAKDSSASVKNSSASAEPEADEALLMPSLEVVTTDSGSQKTDNTSAEGSYSFGRSAIEQYGSSNGNLTEILDTVPNIQFSDDAADADSLSSLKPASVSISGGRYYDNNFSINGISNNSLIDPAGADTPDNAINDVPGHEQAIFFDLDQLESITVYDSNVPAEYGGFTGGVVDAKIRRPGYDSKTRMGYHTTRSDWVNYKVIVNNVDEEDPLAEPPQKPEFSRQRFSLSHERALNDEHTMRISLTGSQSTTPELNYNETKDVKAQNINLTFTHGYEGDELTATSFISYSPFEKDTFIEDVKDSDYTLSGGGILASSDIRFYSGSSEHELTLAASYSENSRQAEKNFYNWANSNSRNWGLKAGYTSSREGGYGDLDKFQGSLSANWKVSTPLRHTMFNNLRYGMTLSQSYAGFERPQDTYIYKEAHNENTLIQCVNQTDDCVQNEQYFRNRQVYPEDSATVSLTEAALFSEISLTWQKIKATAGLRLDYDNFLKNFNISWRTRATYDVFNDETVIINAGANRYYSSPLLTYKLNQAAEPYYEEERTDISNVVTNWEYGTGTGSYKYNFQDVRTPYSDELVLGVKALMFGGTGEIKALDRNNEDEFARTTTGVQSDGYRHYLMNNDGYSSYQSLSLSWDKSNDVISYGFHITYSETKSSNDTYSDNVDAATSDEIVWYKGEARTLSDINQLRQNYARPIIASAYTHVPLSDQIHVTFKARYKSSYKTVVRGSGSTNQGTTIIDGVRTSVDLDNYKDSTRPASLLFDSKLSWQPVQQYDVTLIAEIKNLFDGRTHTVREDDDDGIEIGRQLWLGLEAEF